MSWEDSKRKSLERQYGICSVCGYFLNKDYVGHHIKNRSQKGDDSEENCEVRHPFCERYMHINYRFGNFQLGVVKSISPYTYKKRPYYKKERKLYRGQGKRH
jgi:5-methylcytosine-specific restriction endonuclease McrA